MSEFLLSANAYLTTIFKNPVFAYPPSCPEYSPHLYHDASIGKSHEVYKNRWVVVLYSLQAFPASVRVKGCEYSPKNWKIFKPRSKEVHIMPVAHSVILCRKLTLVRTYVKKFFGFFWVFVGRQKRILHVSGFLSPMEWGRY